MRSEEFTELSRSFATEFANLNFFDGELTEDEVSVVMTCEVCGCNKALIDIEKLDGLRLEFDWSDARGDGNLVVYKKLKEAVIHGEE